MKNFVLNYSEFVNKHRGSLLLLLTILSGLVFTLYLMLQPQNIRLKASSDINSILKITANNTPLTPEGNVYTTNADSITIQIKENSDASIRGQRTPILCPTIEDITQNKTPGACTFFAGANNIDIFNTNFTEEQKNTYIEKYSSVYAQALNQGRKIQNPGSSPSDPTSEEFERRTQIIIDAAKNAGFNPVIFLGYWRTEGNFSLLSAADFGCEPTSPKGRTSFENELRCALESAVSTCARSQNSDSSACNQLRSIRSRAVYNRFSISYPITTFNDFVEAYGSFAVDPNNCTHTYNQLVEVALELNACM